MPMELPLSAEVLYILEALEKHGHRADVVGGCVRDFLMGKAPYDVDITTSASPEEMKAIFAKEKTVETGIKHGTLTVLVGGAPYEVTTYRVDGEYEDHRHPAEVLFTKNLAEDLARRDFTVNAMCYSPKNGLTDLYGGREDLEKGVIRAVGEAEKRFTEDALRILRGLRFSATLGFEIEEKTAAAMKKCAHLLSFVSAERVFAEWKKLLGGKDARRVLEGFAPVLSVAIPALAEIPVEQLPALDFLSAEERMLLLFALPPASPCCESRGEGEAQKGKIAAARFEKAALALRADKQFLKRGAQILAHFFDEDKKTEESLLHLLYYLGAEGAISVYRLRASLAGAEGSESREKILFRLSKLQALIETKPCVSVADLAVDGQAVSSLGYKGKRIGERLTDALFAVMGGRVENTQEALLSYLKEN